MLFISAFYYFSIWCILSGDPDTTMLITGFIASLTISYLVNRDTEQGKIKFLKFLQYSFWLTKEVSKSSLTTIKIILTGKIRPSFEKIEISNISELGHTIFDNSITLTPGTVCISDKNNNVLIHALHTDFLHDIKSGLLEHKMRETVK
ncbi:MAG: Na+/H+ antiporter subunit E [Alphaproteobacteria bacterium]|nr:Na+/H+ antiporter subunit E [Alphaproteobacteria bacterium]